MTSKNARAKRADTPDEDIPAETAQREAQDRASGQGHGGQARSPVDSMHVDAPKHQDNARGHAHDDARGEKR